MSNIMSFDFHRKSLGELQREIERINIKLRDYEEWRVWQEAYIEAMEMEMNQIKADHEFINNSILSRVQSLYEKVMKLGNKDGP